MRIVIFKVFILLWKDSMFQSSQHTFAICAYKESPFLEECILSLKGQAEPTNIIMSTATPNTFISSMAQKHEIPLFINTKSPSIGSDWNFAYCQTKTPLVTIAHQDDIYCSEYAEQMLAAINHSVNPLLYFTDYGEIRGENKVDKNRLLSIKRFLLAPLTRKRNQRSIFVRRRILSLGSPICCPSVTMVKSSLGTPFFQEDFFKCNLDWQAWEKASRLEGSFVYNSNILLYHRIHEDSETSLLIEDNTRGAEDLAMLELFWPTFLAKFVNHFYARGQKSNG